MDFNTLNVPTVAIPSMTSGREAQYVRRLKELEDEIQSLRAENEKHVCSLLSIRFPPSCAPNFTESDYCEIP